MDAPSNLSVTSGNRSASERLNKECLCITIDRDALCQALEREVGDTDFCSTFIKTRPHLFSNAPVFISESETDEMLRIVRAIEAATRLSGYQAAALSWAPEIAQHDFGPRGAFMGYDFHLAAGGPKLIEVNTNAGGAFLNAVLAKAQLACCTEIEGALDRVKAGDFESAVLHMFQREWVLQRGVGTPRRIAIVDDRPEEQYLYPEFLLAQRFLLKHGIETVVADAEKLRYEQGGLAIDGPSIDLVYNRLVDFAFERPEHKALRAAYLDNAVVVTPNPRVHALYADKRNLALLSDEATLRTWGLPAEMLGDLSGVPLTVATSPLRYAATSSRLRPFGSGEYGFITFDGVGLAVTASTATETRPRRRRKSGRSFDLSITCPISANSADRKISNVLASKPNVWNCSTRFPSGSVKFGPISRSNPRAGS